jgi:triacylglycerol lipase
MRSPYLLVAVLAGCATNEPPAYDKAQAAADADADNGDGKADGLDICSLAGWYGDRVCDRFCAKLDPDCPLIGNDPAGTPTRYPIILHHGMAGGRSWILTYNGIAEALRADGHTVVQDMVPPFDGVEVRAQALKQAIDDTLARTGAAKVNIIAHAMGGLDARYLISTLGYGDKVATLSTMSTPHRGAALADFALQLSPGDLLLNAIALVVGAAVSDVGGDPHLRAAMQAMAEARADAFNAANADDPRVYYQSWAGVSSLFGASGSLAACDDELWMLPGTFDKVRPEFMPFVGIVGHNRGDAHDGMVTVASAKWGVWRGCVPADHSDEIGQMTTARPNPRTSWDPQRFWRQVAFELSANGY